MVLSIGESGAYLTVRDVENWALQNEHRSELTKQQFAEIKKQVTLLPEGESVRPTMRDLLVVYLGKDETPRFYHLYHPPKAIEAIYKIAKVRLPSY